MKKKFISEDNLRESWKHIDNLKQDKLPDGKTGSVLVNTDKGIEWKDDYLSEVTSRLNIIEQNYVTEEEASLTYQPVGEYFTNAQYNQETREIEFYYNDTLVVSLDRDEILGDAIKDGMLDNVELIGNDLVFTFNTDADKTAIRISLTDFLNPELFAKKEEVYTKEETDQQIENALYEIATNGYETVDMGDAGIWARYPI